MTEQPPRHNTRQYIAIFLVLLAIALSWAKPIDNFTENYINDAIKTAAIIFGVSRAINATVSVTQSAEVGVGVSISPGEILDPINDLIERFSEVMTFSIASLAFQKILLQISAHWIFNALVTLSAAAFLTALLVRKHQTITLKVFAILLVVRLFLSLVILANSAVDRVFLDSQVERGKTEMVLIKHEVAAVSQTSMGQGEIHSERIAQIHRELKDNGQEKARLLASISANEEKISALESKKPHRPWWKPEFLTRNRQLKATNAEISQLEDQIAKSESMVSNLGTTASTLNEEQACLEKRSRGEECSWIETIQSASEQLKIPSLDIEDKIDSLITLMALVVLRSILLPMFFWIVIYKSIRWIWSKQIAPH